jgi:hypothetical protein
LGGFAGANPRLLGTYEFLKELGKAGGFKHDVTAFYQRWILGRGTFRLTAAFIFNRSARSSAALISHQLVGTAFRAEQLRIPVSLSCNPGFLNVLHKLLSTLAD